MRRWQTGHPSLRQTVFQAARLEAIPADRFGWATLNLATVPLLLIALGATLLVGRQNHLAVKPI